MWRVVPFPFASNDAGEFRPERWVLRKTKFIYNVHLVVPRIIVSPKVMVKICRDVLGIFEATLLDRFEQLLHVARRRSFGVKTWGFDQLG